MMHTELWENCTVASPLLTLPQCWNKIKAWHLFAKISTLLCTKFLNMSRRKLFSHDLLFTLSAGCMRDGRLNGRYLPLDSQPRDGVSQVNVQGLSPGCSSDSCKRNQCSPPFTCVDLWRVHECRYKNSSSVNVPRLKSRKCFFCAKKKIHSKHNVCTTSMANMRSLQHAAPAFHRDHGVITHSKAAFAA